MSEYEGETPTIAYGDPWDEFGEATFARVCPLCGRFVKADDSVSINEKYGPKEPNATCARCGRVGMPFVGYL